MARRRFARLNQMEPFEKAAYWKPRMRGFRAGLKNFRSVETARTLEFSRFSHRLGRVTGVDGETRGVEGYRRCAPLRREL
jgi:hypothetical protein